MASLNVWDYLGMLALIFLIVAFTIGKNAIWGMFTLGLIACFIVGIYTKFSDGNINWELLKIIATVSVLIGAFFEIIGRIGKAIKK